MTEIAKRGKLVARFAKVGAVGADELRDLPRQVAAVALGFGRAAGVDAVMAKSGGFGVRLPVEIHGAAPAAVFLRVLSGFHEADVRPGNASAVGAVDNSTNEPPSRYANCSSPAGTSIARPQDERGVGVRAAIN